MVNCVTYSRNLADEVILHSLDQHLQSKSAPPNSRAGNSSKFISAIELLLQLSVQGKLAVVRGIAEELAVLEHLLEVKR